MYKEKYTINTKQRKRRDRLQIMAEILEIAKNGSLKTQIMYRANLSFAQLNEYLNFLLEVKLLEAINQGGKGMYRTTMKGTEFLQNYFKIRDLLRRKGENTGLENSGARCLGNSQNE